VRNENGDSASQSGIGLLRWDKLFDTEYVYEPNISSGLKTDE